MESIRVQVDMFNKSYLEVSEWLERAENFQSEQESIDMDLRSIRVLIKQQKVCSHVYRKYGLSHLHSPHLISFAPHFCNFVLPLASSPAFYFSVLTFTFQSCLLVTLSLICKYYIFIPRFPSTLLPCSVLEFALSIRTLLFLSHVFASLFQL